MVDVVVVGSCNTDLLSSVPRLPRPGETLHGTNFSVGFGGKGANQCVAAARLGARTAIVAKVGVDSFGRDYIQNLKEQNINIDHVHQTTEAPTGVAPIAVDENGQNAIIIVCGANLKLSADDVMGAEELLEGSKVLVCQLEILPQTTLAALKLAKKHGVTSILNPAPAQEDLDPEMYKTCDIFCPNETEAEIITKSKVSTVDEAKAAVTRLQELGCNTVIITLGVNGTVFATKDDPTPVHVPTNKVTPVDTTGAGDSFVGSLAFYLSRHPEMPLKSVIQYSSAIATVSVCKHGTQTSYPYAKDLPADIPLGYNPK